MRQEIEKVYGNLLAKYRGGDRLRAPGRRDRDRELVVMADMAIDRAISAQSGPIRVRQDARLFLLINLHLLVISPLDDVDQSLVRSDDGFTEDLERDMNDVIGAAIQTSHHVSDRDYVESIREISAADIVRGLASVIDQLKLKDWRLWDDL